MPTDDDVDYGLGAVDRCRQACVEVQGQGVTDAHLAALLADCIEVCDLASSFLRRRSPHVSWACVMCAEVSAALGLVCRNLGGLPQLAACAAACGACEYACGRLATGSQLA